MTCRGARAGLLAALLAPLIALGTWWTSSPAPAAPAGGVVALGGSVTEIVYALGQQDRLVARDTTSSYPPEAEALPDVGYVRALSPEGVLSVEPTLILAEEGAGPPETIDILRAASVPMVTIPEALDGAGIAAKIRAVGAALDVPDEADILVRKVEDDLARVEQMAEAAAGATPKRVLFVLSTEGGRIMASGTDTAADAIIGLAGGVNAVDGFKGYKPMTDEAVAAAAPDAILMMDRGGDHGATVDELLAMPAVAPTRASRDRAVVRLNGLLLLGFGPRTPEAVERLSRALYGS